MVKINPDLKRQKVLKQLEEQKEKAEQELKDMEKKLEAAVEELSEDMEREELESEQDEEPEEVVDVPETPGGQISLEERMQMEQAEQSESGGPAYEVQGSDLENLPDIYNQVKQDLEAGRFMSDNVQNAMNMIYTLNKAENDKVYVSQDAHTIVRKDRQEGQYVNRLQSLFKQVEEQTSIDKGYEQ